MVSTELIGVPPQRILDHGDAILSVREKKGRKKLCLVRDPVSTRKPMHHHLSPTGYKILTGLLSFHHRCVMLSRLSNFLVHVQLLWYPLSACVAVVLPLFIWPHAHPDQIHHTHIRALSKVERKL